MTTVEVERTTLSPEQTSIAERGESNSVPDRLDYVALVALDGAVEQRHHLNVRRQEAYERGVQTGQKVEAFLKEWGATRPVDHDVMSLPELPLPDAVEFEIATAPVTFEFSDGGAFHYWLRARAAAGPDIHNGAVAYELVGLKKEKPLRETGIRTSVNAQPKVHAAWVGGQMHTPYGHVPLQPSDITGYETYIGTIDTVISKIVELRSSAD